MFDPFGWAARHVSESALHRWIRWGAFAFFAGFTVRRVAEYPAYASKPLWFVETLVFVCLAWAYAVRSGPVDRARGAAEVLVPLVGAAWPFALLLTPPHPAWAAHPGGLQWVFGGMTSFTALTVWGLWCLRGAFSIAVEARRVVSRGPYRWVRHPVYLGELGSAAAVAAWRWSWGNAVLWVGFAAVQLLRARLEERKLLSALPDYAPYARRAWWFWRAARP